MENFLSFVHLAFVGFVALLPPVNPIGTALVMDPLLEGLQQQQRKAAALRISFYCLCICVGATLAGSWLFEFFGISLPVVQIAGGIMICHMGWQFLSSDEQASDSKSIREAPRADVSGILFSPLAFPMTTGAGTISVLLTLSAHGHSGGDAVYLRNLSALFLAVLVMCVAIYLSYAYTPALIRRLGHNGQQVLNRLSAFLVFCVGLQIFAEGVAHYIKAS